MATKLNDEILNAALIGFEKQKADLSARIAELKQMLGGGAKEPAAKAAAPARKRRRLSAAGRKAISEAAKRRWALQRAGAEKPQRAAKKA
ncbi:MAG: hypothetical protein ABSB88_05550 [Bryobacteraceae bacterium]|jgi:hypothetical protein